MKFNLIRKFLGLILFTLLHLWFMVFNWPLFITMLNVNLGFGVVRLPPFVVLFLAGFVILGIQSWIGYVNSLHRIINELEDELARRKKDRQPSNSKGLRFERGKAANVSPPVDGNQRNQSKKDEGKERSSTPDWKIKGSDFGTS